MFALDLLLRRLPDSLVDDTAGKRLRLIGDQFPDACSGRVGLEARLHDDGQVDLLLLAATRRQLAVLAGADPTIRLPERFAAAQAWLRTARVAERSLALLRSGSPLPAPIWLEFDAGPDPAELPVPGLFTAAAPDPDSRYAEGWDVVATVTEVLAAAAGQPATALAPQVARVAASGLAVRQVGCFPGRGGDAVRLFCAAPSTVDALTAALRAAGWDGPVPAVRRWAATATPWADAIHLCLDVTPDGVLPGVGIELSLAGAVQPAQDPRWAGLLDVLTQAGLCTSAKRAALCGLGGEYQADLIGRRRYRQGLHHLKITVSASGSATAKAYFGAYEVVPS